MTNIVWPPEELPTRVDDLATPALIIDAPRLAGNIAKQAQDLRDSGVSLRPHVKTSKSWFVAEQQLRSGAIGFTCSTPAEVAWLIAQDVDDLLWAHVPVGRPKVDFTVAAAATGKLTVALDSVEAGRPLSEAASSAGVVVPFVLEVNTGHARNGTDPDQVVDRVQELSRLRGLRFRGILTHEGQLASVNAPDDRAGAGVEAGTLMVRLAQDLAVSGHQAEIVSVGSTPGAASVPYVDGITEARPGTYVYYDMNQTRLGSCTQDQCAMTVLARVVSMQREGRAIIDAGLKAMSSDTIATAGNLGLACDLDMTPLAEVTFAEANEEHGFLIGSGAAKLAVGDLVRVIPNHACGTTNMWSSLIAVDGRQVLARHPISARY